MGYTLDNGLFFMVEDNGIVLPAINDEIGRQIDFDTSVSPFLYNKQNGDFEICAKFSPVNMSLSDSYGIYAYIENEENSPGKKADNYCYIALTAGMQGSCVKSGGHDLMDFENPDTLTEGEDVYLKMNRNGDCFEVSYSNDGTDFVTHGKYNLQGGDTVKAGFRLSSFQGSEFHIKVSDIIMN